MDFRIGESPFFSLLNEAACCIPLLILLSLDIPLPSQRYSQEQWFSNLNARWNHLEGLLKQDCWLPPPEFTNSVDLERDLRIYIYIKLSVAAAAAGPNHIGRTTGTEQLIWV